jgi:hypothetical protein
MRVALITFHDPVNYGAVLQCYAMCQVLKGLGHEVQVLDYHRSRPPLKKNRRKSLRQLPRAILRRVKSFAKEFFPSEIERVFAGFVAAELPISSVRYEGVNALRATPPEADAYICGSDQIWNDRFWSGYDEAYFLRFGGANIRRIAYAPGVPGADFKNGDAQTLYELVLGIDSVSAREKIGQRLIKEVTGIEVPIVADPTILHGNFEGVLRPVKSPKKYIFTYILSSKEALDCAPDTVINRMKGELGLPVVSASLSGKRKAYSPFEWLWLIRNSECFITNSYHGLIFALLFKRNFYVLARDGNPNGQDARMLYLLDKYGLADRYIKRVLDIENVSEIDWLSVAEQMKKDRHCSYGFLNNALSTQSESLVAKKQGQ